jgi:hypothetical protein
MEVRPNKEEFSRLARDFDVVPVIQELTSDTVRMRRSIPDRRGSR